MKKVSITHKYELTHNNKPYILTIEVDRTGYTSEVKDATDGYVVDSVTSMAILERYMASNPVELRRFNS